MSAKLSKAQVRALRTIEHIGSRGASPWAVGTVSCNSLRKKGLVAVIHDPCCSTPFGGRFGYDPSIKITAAGRSALAALDKKGW